MHDKFKKKHRSPRADDRIRQQIAREAARRMFATLVPDDGSPGLKDASEADYYAAKRKAAAVLGHTVRPGDLPSDVEVREAVMGLLRDNQSQDLIDESVDDDEPSTRRLADHLDRFAIYKMRLEPLAQVKQNPKWHPEGDALYHSLQVFERAKQVRPYDEEFLLAALLHDVGKGIDPNNHVSSALIALEGTLTPRSAWLVDHHMDLLNRSDRPLSPKVKALIEASEYYDDLVLLRECDDAGREIGVPVGSIDEAISYLRGLEAEAYLEH